jgi:hypothetical protein
LVIDPLHRATLRINDVLRAVEFATYVTASAPVVVERPMYLGSPNGPSPSGSDLPGSNGPALEARFAGGESGPGYQERVLLLNPTVRPARLRLVLFPETGARWTRPIMEDIAVPPLARQTVDIGAMLRGVSAGAHAITLRSLNGVGFVAEQSIFFRRAGHILLESAPALGT